MCICTCLYTAGHLFEVPDEPGWCSSLAILWACSIFSPLFVTLLPLLCLEQNSPDEPFTHFTIPGTQVCFGADWSPTGVRGGVPQETSGARAFPPFLCGALCVGGLGRPAACCVADHSLRSPGLHRAPCPAVGHPSPGLDGAAQVRVFYSTPLVSES